MFRKALFVLAIAAMPVLAQSPVTERPNAPQSPAVQPAPVQQQQPAAPGPQASTPQRPQTWNVANSNWVGVESFERGVQRVGFSFNNGGSAQMVDDNGKADCGYVQSGNQITITLGNCIYRGTLQRNVLVGRATMTSGPNQGHTWDFALANVK